MPWIQCYSTRSGLIGNSILRHPIKTHYFYNKKETYLEMIKNRNRETFSRFFYYFFQDFAIRCSISLTRVVCVADVKMQSKLTND